MIPYQFLPLDFASFQLSVNIVDIIGFLERKFDASTPRNISGDAIVNVQI
jgi:hypothetical protein